MTLSRFLPLLAAAGALFAAPAFAQCLDPQSELTLTGKLAYRILPGAPDYQDVTEGDAPDPAFLLDLPQPVCLSGGDFGSASFSQVRLRASAADQAALRRGLGAEVTVSLTQPKLSQTPRKTARLVATVVKVASASPKLPPPAGDAQFASGYPVVQAFYLALEAGSGAEAARFIAPEARHGPFDPAAMTKFYGNLPEPLKLVSVDPAGIDRYKVAYRFGTGASVCNGQAVVKTSYRDGHFYISSIQALSGC